MRDSDVRRALIWIAAAAAFSFVATLNTSGYRYGVGDQAFYIPAISLHLDPSLFPRDRLLFEGQDRLMLFDEAAAAVVSAGVGLPALFLGLHLATLVLMFGAGAAIAWTLFRSVAATIAVCAAMTLWHRITKTGVNTLEGYLHPRVLAFAIALAAVAALLRGRSIAALGLAIAAVPVHPVIGLMFLLFVAAGCAAVDPRTRVPLGAAALLSLPFAAWLVTAGPLAGALTRMDEAWLSVLASKDYVFPSAWEADAWAVNLAYPVVIGAAFLGRRRSGDVAEREHAVLWGSVAVTLLFLIGLPLVAARIALAVQVQMSRVFWILDFFAIAYAAWWVTERAPGVFGLRRPTAPLVVAGAVALAALGRGLYQMGVVHPERTLIRADLPDDDWSEVGRWARDQPAATGLLADPGHAWRFGTSLRVTALRDVFVEEQKDTAMAMYSARSAARVAERLGATAGFDAMTAEVARDLARRYQIDYLVIARPMELPIAYRSGRFTVYRLR
jgi:hypothetical protein